MTAAKAKPPARAMPTRPAVLRAIKAADWLEESDAGAVALCTRLARDLDRAKQARDVATLANALQRALTAIGLTIDSRPKEVANDADPIDAQRASVTDLRAHKPKTRNAKN